MGVKKIRYVFKARTDEVPHESFAEQLGGLESELEDVLEAVD